MLQSLAPLPTLLHLICIRAPISASISQTTHAVGSWPSIHNAVIQPLTELSPHQLDHARSNPRNRVHSATMQTNAST
ncbi:hypothetical protein M011DRAFT_465183 [Sporormia fimetaria CBS 119925]|uniref:Secreted protein n=1 Tax=Sporormia fimetaria CBS 119925 TaxID=1340428 RepID=A0A6A6VKV5_9PLEO|nr:hypothetical protein M011DRAFT_465183 [Sporormia fimetaria CBS 119925]